MKDRMILISLLVMSLATGCNKKDADNESLDDTTSNAVQSAMGIANSIGNDTEATTRTDQFSYDETLGRAGLISESSAEFKRGTSDDIEGNESTIQSMDEGRAACSYSSVIGTCSAGAVNLNWNSCTIALSTGNATLTGGWTYSYLPTSDCSTAITSGLPDNSQVTATSSGSTVTFPSGATLITSTEAHSTYNGVSIPSTGISVSRSGVTRSVTINGLHRVLKGPRGRTWFDHSFKTGSTPISVSGSKATTRTVTGQLTYYHNLAQYTGTHTFTSVTWGSSSCSYPTSGSITSTFTGSITGTSTLTFSSTCGSATFSYSDSATPSPSPAALTLTYKL